MDGHERVFDDDKKQRAWLEGCRREEAISGLLERHGDRRLSIADVDEVAWELGVSRATLYRLIAAFRAKRTVSSVEPRSRGRRKNGFVLDAQARETHLAGDSGDLFEARTADYDLFDRTGEGEMRARGTAAAGPPHDQGAG